MKTTILEERERYLQMREQCKKKIEELPQGTVYIKKRNSCEYIYLVYYNDEGKQNHKYIGKDKAVIPVIQEQIKERKYLKTVLKELDEDLRTLDKMIKTADELAQRESQRVSPKEVTIKEHINKKPLLPPIR